MNKYDKHAISFDHRMYTAGSMYTVGIAPGRKHSRQILAGSIWVAQRFSAAINRLTSSAALAAEVTIEPCH